MAGSCACSRLWIASRAKVSPFTWGKASKGKTSCAGEAATTWCMGMMGSTKSWEMPVPINCALVDLMSPVGSLAGSVAVAIVPLTLDVHEQAMRLAERYRLHIFDANIAAAALPLRKGQPR